MFRVTIRVNENTEVDGTMIRLARRAEGVRLSPDILETVLEQTRAITQGFWNRGMALTDSGSQMSATQRVEGLGYSIKIQGRFGVKESTWERSARVLWRERRV